MKRAVPLLILTGLLLAIFAGIASAKDEQALTGAYVWDGGGARGKLRAVFKSTGVETWDVSFYFTFQGQPHTYVGTAEGSLTNGALQGKVLNENRRRTFVFHGSFDDGEFQGTHAEYRRNKEHRMGTLTLAR